jgi:hypothetical protein
LFSAFPVLLLDRTVSDWGFSLKEGITSLCQFTPQNVYKFFTNPVFSVSFLLFFNKKDVHHAVLLALTLFYVYSVANHPLYYGSTFRYTFSLMPLHLFYVVKWFSKK